MGANPIGRGERAEEAGVADFAQERRHGGEDRLHGAVAADDAPVLAAAALVVGGEDEEKRALHPFALERDGGLGVELRHEQLLLGRVRLAARHGAVAFRQTLHVGAELRDPDRDVGSASGGEVGAEFRERLRIFRNRRVGVVVEGVEIREDVVFEKRLVVGRVVGRNRKTAVQDRNVGADRPEGERGDLQKRGVFPDRFRREGEVRLVPELPVVRAVAEGGGGGAAEVVEGARVAGKSALGLRPRGAVVEHPRNADAALVQHPRVREIAAEVGRGVGRRLDMAPVQPVAHVAEAAEREQVRDRALGVAAVPRAEKRAAPRD